MPSPPTPVSKSPRRKVSKVRSPKVSSRRRKNTLPPTVNNSASADELDALWNQISSALKVELGEGV